LFLDERVGGPLSFDPVRPMLCSLIFSSYFHLVHKNIFGSRLNRFYVAQSYVARCLNNPSCHKSILRDMLPGILPKI
jgi:hypothetical protein